tara:strand:- start:5124 stop:5402 length:279 start_codon:yes stop_codon:yes gene_type:complete
LVINKKVLYLYQQKKQQLKFKTMNEKTLIENLTSETTNTKIQKNEIEEKMQTSKAGTQERQKLNQQLFALNAKLNTINSLIEIEQALKTFNL